MWDSTAVHRSLSTGNRSSSPWPKPGRYPYFLYAVPKGATCAAFIKESRMEFLEANQPHREYGVWGTHHSLPTEITPLAMIGFLEVCEKFRLIIWASSGETEHFVFDRGYLLGWPAFGAA